MEENTSENNVQMNKQEKGFTEKMRSNPWMVSTFVLGLIVLILVFANFSGMTGNVISEDDAAQKLLSYYESAGVDGLSVDSVEEKNGLYQVNFEYDGAVVPVYVTKDGELTGSMNTIAPVQDTPTQTQSQPADVPKSDKPLVQLFIMTHCPYGTQAEKGFIPFMNAFGDYVDAEIRFVHYFMHDPEEIETPRQVCIREEQPSKFVDYLTYFLEEGDATYAEEKSGIDVDAMNECIDSGKWEEYYAEDSELSQAAGVQGSPTLVVNGVKASSGRSPSAYLDTACSAFNTAPSECESLELSSASPAPMWGWDASSTSATTAQC